MYIPKTGDFAELEDIAREDRNYKDLKKLIGEKFWIGLVFPLNGSWVSATAALLFKKVPLNGTHLEQGGHLWFGKAKFKPFSLN